MNYNPLEQKVIAICGLIIFLLSSLQAQDPSRPNTIFGKALFLDHYSPQEGALSSFENFTNGFEIGYLRNISPNFNAVIPLKVGVIKLPGETDNRRYVGVDFVGQLQYYTEESRIIPYGLLGLGAVSEDFGTLNFQVPIGAGVHVRLGKYAFINLQGEYRVAFVDDRSNLQYGLGIAFMLGDLDEVLPPPLEFPLTDTDQDGIDDSKDECPEIAGLAILGGCPDTDGDGLSDAKDECPEKYGPKETNGCPDSDGDGIVDSKDDCPNVKGEARFNGCPDTDGDGIPDLRDKCPNSPAPNSPIGCPEIKQEDKAVLDYALQAVQFETGVDVLKEDSKLVLDQVIDVLKRYPDFRLEIIGHTDNVGSEINNLKLSQRRAKACYDYLLSKGISAKVMNSGGFGESNPIVSNDTVEGRSLNRRVEFILDPR